MTKNTTCKAESLVITMNTLFSYIQGYHALFLWRIHKMSVNVTGNCHESSFILECKRRIWQQNTPLQSLCRSKIWQGNRLEGISIGLFMQQFWMFVLQWTWTLHDFMFLSFPFRLLMRFDSGTCLEAEMAQVNSTLSSLTHTYFLVRELYAYLDNLLSKDYHTDITKH